MVSKTCARCSILNAGAAKAVPAPRVRATRPDAGTCYANAAPHGSVARSATRARSPGNCWRDGAWCSAMLPRASRWLPRGAICWWSCAAWNRAARFAAAALSHRSSASSSRCRKRWTYCARYGERARTPRRPKGRDLGRRCRDRRRMERWLRYRRWKAVAGPHSGCRTLIHSPLGERHRNYRSVAITWSAPSGHGVTVCTWVLPNLVTASRLPIKLESTRSELANDLAVAEAVDDKASC